MSRDAGVMPDAGREFTRRVRQLVVDRLAQIAASLNVSVDVEQLAPGKLLRTRLAARLFEDTSDDDTAAAAVAACAATELVHSASLCHDDVIDSGLVRRGKPAFWRTRGVRGAILVGDLLLCESMDLLIPAVDADYVANFVAKVSETVRAETEQELTTRGRCPDEETCLRLARYKTGPLFALTAGISRWHDVKLRLALEEAGYMIGTAYQLADDILDMSGREKEAGKTLGTDMKRLKATLPAAWPDGQGRARDHIVELLRSTPIVLNEWPKERDAVTRFLENDLEPAIDSFVAPQEVSEATE